MKRNFYEVLNRAQTEETSLIIIINKIMPMINKYSLDLNNELDEDLRNELIEYAIKLIKSPNFPKKFLDK